MNLTPLRIGDLTAKIPIIQGGMGVGVSSSRLAGAVAKEGGIGIIASVQLGYDEPDFEQNAVEATMRAIQKHVQKAKEYAAGGIVGVNIMVALNKYEDAVRAAIQAGTDLIISGAGLPLHLPKLVAGTNVKIAPIVSSLKAARVILKMWDRHDHVAPDLVVIEGPKAGGHLGFQKEDLGMSSEEYDQVVCDIIEETSKYAEKHQKQIPVVVAGGVFTGQDIAHYMKLGASGVQMATRFVATEECDAAPEFKQAYMQANAEDVVIVKSPVGMPGRALRNAFVKRMEGGREAIKRCYDCLSACNPAETPYCISKALIEAVKGNVDEGLIFCGENVSRVKEITTVKKLMQQLVHEAEEA